MNDEPASPLSESSSFLVWIEMEDLHEKVTEEEKERQRRGDESEWSFVATPEESIG